MVATLTAIKIPFISIYMVCVCVGGGGGGGGALINQKIQMNGSGYYQHDEMVVLPTIHQGFLDTLFHASYVDDLYTDPKYTDSYMCCY